LRLPLCEDVEVPRRKITEYLLNLDHPVGAPKARFFVGRGFRTDNPDELEAALIHHACRGVVVGTEMNRWGTKYVVGGRVDGADGAPMSLRSVWIQVTESDAPTFVTAYPVSET
jgi:hypothetical protein